MTNYGFERIGLSDCVLSHWVEVPTKIVVIAFVVMCIVLLNLLVAMMGDTYEPLLLLSDKRLCLRLRFESLGSRGHS